MSASNCRSMTESEMVEPASVAGISFIVVI